MKRLLIIFSFLFILSFPVLSDNNVNDRDAEKIIKALELLQKDYSERSERANQYRSLTITSLVAIGSALIGAFIPSLFNYLSKKSEYENEQKKKMYGEKINAYKDYLDALGKFANCNGPKTMYELQKCTHVCLMYAGKDLSDAMNNYFILHAKLATGKIEVDDSNRQDIINEIEKSHANIMNCMRKEIGASESDRLDTVVFAKFK